LFILSFLIEKSRFGDYDIVLAYFDIDDADPKIEDKQKFLDKLEE
jgi:hypothetical protein